MFIVQSGHMSPFCSGDDRLLPVLALGLKPNLNVYINVIPLYKSTLSLS